MRVTKEVAMAVFEGGPAGVQYDDDALELIRGGGIECFAHLPVEHQCPAVLRELHAAVLMGIGFGVQAARNSS